KATMREACAAACALMRALAANVVPVSFGSGSASSPADVAEMPYGSSSSRISSSLPGLWVAITSRPWIGRAIGTPLRLHHRKLLQIDQLGDAFAGQSQQSCEFFLAEGRFLRRRLHLDQPAIAGHDEIGVGLGFRIFRI